MVQGLGIGGSSYKPDRPLFPSSLACEATTTLDTISHVLGMANVLASNAQPFAYKSDDPYRTALVNMASDAVQLGANAILSIRYQVFPEPASGGPIVFAYGTAVILQTA